MKKNKINWLCNQVEIKSIVKGIGARNISIVQAVYGTPTTEEQIKSYIDMVRYESKEADRKLLKWCQDVVKNKPADEPRYIYFRVIRY